MKLTLVDVEGFLKDVDDYSISKRNRKLGSISGGTVLHLSYKKDIKSLLKSHSHSLGNMAYLVEED